jgi:RNA polymerase sigma factor (sigma-70 family)
MHAQPTAAPAADFIVLDLDQLCRQYRQHVCAFVSKFVRDPADAEDITQMTFLEATRCAPRFAGQSRPSTWLFGIAHNLARNHQRRSCRTPEHLDVEDWSELLADDGPDPQRLAESRDLLAKSLALMEGMSSDLQRTFLAVLDDEQSYDSAARELGLPIGTVRSRLSRIRTRLRVLTPGSAQLHA